MLHQISLFLISQHKKKQRLVFERNYGQQICYKELWQSSCISIDKNESNSRDGIIHNFTVCVQLIVLSSIITTFLEKIDISIEEK